MGRLSKPKKTENQKVIEYIKKYKEEDCQQSFEAIVDMMESYLQAMTKKFFFVHGHNQDDINQESLIALATKAIVDYDSSKGSFAGFAKLCIKRHIITILKSSNNNKHKALNSACSVDQSVEEDENSSTCGGLIPDENQEMVIDNMIRSESYVDLKNLLKEKLTDLETEILELYLQSMSYSDIVREMNRTRRGKNRVVPKTVDNALCRIKTKAMELEENLKRKREEEEE